MWTSTTKVTWLSADTRDEVWRSICNGRRKKTGEWKEKSKVCCYGLQGLCKYGKSCAGSHDFKLGRKIGCMYGSDCSYGHSPLALAAETADSEAEEFGFDSRPSLDRGVLQNARRIRTDEGAYIECRGLAFDGSDPLWEETSIALLDGNEEIGDADLPSSARHRLAADGCYRLVDEETSDEWLCLPADILQQRLEQSQVRFANIQRDWLVDDLIDARVFWEQIYPVLSRRLVKSKEPDQKLIYPDEADEDLQKVAKRLDVELRKAVELGPKILPMPTDGRAAAGEPIGRLGDEVSGPFVDAVHAAFSAAEELQSMCKDILRRRHERHEKEFMCYGAAAGGTNSEDKVRSTATPIRLCNPLDDEIWKVATDISELYSFRLSQLRRCMGRCIYVCHCALEECQSSSASTFVPSVGAEADIVGLMASAESQLNGRIGLIESFHENLCLWQVRLISSGTRLLLPASQLTKPSRTGSRATRSRSPRSQKRHDASAQVSLLNLVRRAASRGDHILMHHVVK